MVNVRKRGRPRAETTPASHAIIRVAIDLFAKKGFVGSNLREIAQQAQVDVALLSYQFGSKKGLWKAVVEAIGSHIVQELDPETGQCEDGETVDRLKASFAKFIDFCCEYENV